MSYYSQNMLSTQGCNCNP